MSLYMDYPNTVQKQTEKTPTFVYNTSIKCVWHVLGACGDSRIVKYDTAVHEVMDGHFSVLPFEILDIIGNIITVYGYYYICDGGYPKFKFLVCPFKWPQSGPDMALLSDAVGSTRKYIERCCGSMKKRWRILVTQITIREAFRVKQIFMACCALHNILLIIMGETTGVV
jgi:hypothetical protein